MPSGQSDFAANSNLATAADFLRLLKPRVMSLVVFTGLAGMLAAPGHLHPVIALTAIICIAIGAGASGAINMWYDRDIDRVMSRTRRRPVPDGRIAPADALGFGLFLAVGSVLVMGLTVNPVAGALLALTIGFYILIYTMWLKRRTSQNIVIGGAAGAFPPMIGWAAVTGGVDWPAIAMVAIIFFWTPPHFWALALNRTAEYARAGVPMLPVVAGDRETRRQILLYTLVLVPVSFVPVSLGIVGLPYAIAAAAGGIAMTGLAWRVMRRGDMAASRQLFVGSIFYLFGLFGVLALDSLSRSHW